MTVNELIVKNELLNSGFTKEAAAAVMGVAAGESGFAVFKETSYRNTSNERIRSIFPVKCGSLSDAELDKLKASDEIFFNHVYGGMYGNTQPGDGWRYVGRGFNGITFKAVYQSISKATGIDFVNNPELLEKPENAAKALAFYFRAVKAYKTFEEAFQEAYRQNAGPKYSFSYYANSKNAAHVDGIPRKRNKGLKYLSEL